MEQISYRVHIVKGDQAFEVEGDKDFVLQMLERFPITTDSKAKVVAQTKTEEHPSIEKRVSIAEFSRRLGFKKHTDLVLGFAYYLEKQMGVPEFTPADINNLYYEAKLDTSNTSQMIVQNIRRGFMMEAKNLEARGKRAYTITRSGEEYIEKVLQSQPS